MAGNKLVINTGSTGRVRPSGWVPTVRGDYTCILLACQGFTFSHRKLLKAKRGVQINGLQMEGYPQGIF